jgi:hypothetical protein
VCSAKLCHSSGPSSSASAHSDAWQHMYLQQSSSATAAKKTHHVNHFNINSMFFDSIIISIIISIIHQTYH